MSLAWRFNFIAVDYLVYSDEVLNNLLESYPIGKMLSLLAMLALILSVALRKPFNAAMAAPLPALRGRLVNALGLLVLAGLSLQLVSQDSPRTQGGNAYNNDWPATAPISSLPRSVTTNWTTPSSTKACRPMSLAKQLHAELSEPNARFIDQDPLDIRRAITNPGTLRKPNIVLVTIESFSAKYMGSNGDARNLTPILDALRQQSLYFNNFYATGTRTDRGLEAITLAIPPTPGRSIVKRIGRESGVRQPGSTALGHRL